MVAGALAVVAACAPSAHAAHRATGGRPAVLYVHGGGWARAEIRPEERRVARTIRADTGWVVRVARYSTPAGTGYVTEPADVLADLEALRATPGVDPSRVYVWGESAGADLALLTAYRHPGLVAAAVGISTPTDLVTGAPTLGYLTIRYEGESLAASELAGHTRYVTSSPVYEATPGSPPTFLASAAADPAVPPSQAVELGAVLDYYAVPNEVDVVAGTDAHAYDLEPYVMARAIRFLSR